MFKAKLIDNENYYKFRSRHLIIMIIAYVVIIPVMNFFDVPTWAAASFFVIYLLVLIWLFKNQQMMNALFGNRTIEIDSDQIKIISKSKAKEEIIQLDQIEKLVLLEDYAFPMEEMEAIGKELSGKIRKNYIIVKEKGQSRQLDFEIESYYMITQLNKLIQSWETKGIAIERLNQS